MFCGIDVGTQGVRAVVLDADGHLHGEAASPLPAGTRHGREHVQDPACWWTALVTAVASALERAGRPAVEAVCLDATSGTVLVERRDGTARGPALMYDDARAQDEASRAQQAGQALWNALGYRMQPSWALPKVVWLLGHDALGPGDRVVHQADHLAGRLAGAPVATDVSTALKTGVDLRDATWPTDVHETLGIPAGLLPDPVLPGTVIGAVGPDAAAITKLPAGTPIRAGMTDGCAAQIAAGALRPGSWSSALGTTLVLKGSTADLVRDPNGAVYSHRHPDGGWLPGGASSIGAGVIGQLFGAPGPDELAGLTEGAAVLGVVDHVVYPLRGRGERFPFVAPDATSFGLDGLPADASGFAAVCQAIAYVERLAYDVLGLLGADVSGPVSLTGGATRNSWWNQLRTDLLGRPGSVPASGEAAVGMAVLAAAEPGAVTASAERMVRLRMTLEPDPARGAQLEDGYRRLVAALAERGWLDEQVAHAIVHRKQVMS